jgi:hypothetical protein
LYSCGLWSLFSEVIPRNDEVEKGENNITRNLMNCMLFLGLLEC